MKAQYLAPIVLFAANTALANQTHDHTSPYSGEEQRAIKSLSADDIKELESGGGWGLALAAELNGVPGPKHLLELQQEISLSEQQIQQIQSVFDDMQSEAIRIGSRYIAQEQELENQFQSGDVSPLVLKALLQQIGSTLSELRFAHLAAHLEMSEIVTPEQVALYNEIRGYASSDPCDKVPEGHDPDMWKKHNGC